MGCLVPVSSGCRFWRAEVPLVARGGHDIFFNGVWCQSDEVNVLLEVPQGFDFWKGSSVRGDEVMARNNFGKCSDRKVRDVYLFNCG